MTARGVAAGVLVLVVAAVCARLGFWQLDRLEQRQARNAALEAAGEQPELVIETGMAGRLADDPEVYRNRRARLRGVYDGERQIVLRGRAHEGRPGVHLITPLRLAGEGRVVLVNRGWLPSPDGASLDSLPAPPRGERTVRGLLQEVPDAGDGGGRSVARASGTATETFRRLDRAMLASHLPYPVLSLYLQRLPVAGDDGPPHAVAMPALDGGPHLGYAVQWFSFAAIFVIGFGVMVWLRSDRRGSGPVNETRRPERGRTF